MKIGPVPIIVFGVAFAIILLTHGFFWHWQPNKQDAETWRNHANALQTQADLMPQAVRRREQAIAMVNERAEAWQNVVAVKTPPQSLAAGGIDMNTHAWQLTVDARRFRDSMQRAVNRQLKVGGVTVINGPLVPFPTDAAPAIVASYFNYPAIPFPVVIFDLGQVTVQGTYQQITTNVRQWANMPNYLAVADGLTITGTSPILTGTYNLTIVGFIRGGAIFPAVPEFAAPGQQGGGGPTAQNGSGRGQA
jgi:hypothetical protein